MVEPAVGSLMFEPVFVDPFYGQIVSFFSFGSTYLIIALNLIFAIRSIQHYEFSLKQKNDDLIQANHEIESKVSMETEYKIARKLQSQFLPKKIPAFLNYKVDYRYIPSREISGDFLQFHAFGKDKVGFFITDVAGKGLPASFVTLQLYAMFQSVVNKSFSPQEALTLFNRRLYHLPIEKKHCASFYFEINPSSNQLIYSDAGIGFAFLLRDDKLIDLKDEGGLLLGAFQNVQYSEGAHLLLPGDQILVGTDGVVDLKNQSGERLGMERFMGALDSYDFHHHDLCTYIYEYLLSYSGQLHHPDDDITFLTICFKG